MGVFTVLIERLIKVFFHTYWLL